MRTYSLTRRLIGAVLLVQLCSALVLLISVGVYEGVSRFHALDVALRGRADSLLGAVQDAEDPQDNVMLDGTQTSIPSRDIYAVRDEQGRILGHSPNWPDPVADFSVMRPFHKVRLGQRAYRVIRVEGLRMVDPGDKGGGIARHVVILYGAETHPVWVAIAQALCVFATLSLLILLATGWVMLRLLESGLRPLRELALQAGGVSVGRWAFQPSAEALRIRELAPLATALETVLAGLERSFDQQRQFVSDAAHELKTSVAVVKSSLQLVMMRERNPEQYRAGLKRAEQDCERMEHLVQTMLMLAGLESSGSLDEAGSNVAEVIDLEAVVRDVAEHFQSAAELSEVRMSVEVSESVVIQGNREKVWLLCSNLVHNALQHSASGAEIRVLVGGANESAELRVIDTGEGITPEALPHIFDRFYRGDVSRSRRTGGTGLGLAICKAIAQEMDARITVDSRPGLGTHVLVAFPRLAPEVTAPSSASLKLGLP